ncbi:MAG: hypothetical protein O3C36_05175, partial [archaeon]|nr:hypothetical protein [archaeon]
MLSAKIRIDRIGTRADDKGISVQVRSKTRREQVLVHDGRYAASESIPGHDRNAPAPSTDH